MTSRRGRRQSSLWSSHGKKFQTNSALDLVWTTGKALKRFGDWSGEAANFLPTLHQMFSEIVPKAEHRDIMFAHFLSPPKSHEEMQDYNFGKESCRSVPRYRCPPFMGPVSLRWATNRERLAEVQPIERTRFLTNIGNQLHSASERDFSRAIAEWPNSMSFGNRG